MSPKRLNGGNCYKVIYWGKLAANDYIDLIILLMKKIDSGG